MNVHSDKRRKELGAYYTPDGLSQVLADWAIRSSENQVLEPSFGGCGFLEASVGRLKALKARNPVANLYGADVDPEAFKYLSRKLGNLSSIEGKFLLKDFLAVKAEDFNCNNFDVALGNPPYVSYHNMGQAQRASCFEIFNTSSVPKKFPGRHASLWAFFVLHALSFLREEARAAWVLPSSLLHADYAREVTETYKKHFKTIQIIKLNQRLFQASGADELSVILLADGFSKNEISENYTQYSVAKNIDELKLSIEGFSFDETRNSSGSNYKHSIISKRAFYEYKKMEASSRTKLMGQVSDVLIGMVTGKNNSFVIDKNTSIDHCLEDGDLRPVVSKFSDMFGLVHTKKRHEKLVENGARALLVCPADITVRGSRVRQYLAMISRDDRVKNKTFKKRRFWFYPDDERYPDAFLSYMTDKGPKLIVNSAKVNCTNSIHRVFFHDIYRNYNRRGIATSMLSSYTQLSAELSGRSYGSGVLKLEPSAAKNVSLFFSKNCIDSLAEISAKIDRMLIIGKYEEARRLVDEAICESEGLSIDTFDAFFVAVNKLRNDRYEGLNRIFEFSE
ncbi:N-6 DNA methylase [Marinobacter vinifirmus]|uniref:site-specific DNA-methyltransferase (adenine-specific) n=1 Tax=Marinobacter vinifirmus TaxID=355591 RepID=A0A558B874_9GAMM|nr:N-6 DNA methylase [Marinobacter vinifirmus]TVT32698.1 MAG: N-6 DNA methylase [Marinobacter vinifirmus]